MSMLLLLLLSRFSRVQLCATSETAAHQAPPSLGFSRQEYWSGLPCSPPRDLPNPGIEPRSPALQANSLLSDPLDMSMLLSHFIPPSSSCNYSKLTVTKAQIHA